VVATNKAKEKKEQTAAGWCSFLLFFPISQLTVAIIVNIYIFAFCS
jgi:hypothetical protein